MTSEAAVPIASGSAGAPSRALIRVLTELTFGAWPARRFGGTGHGSARETLFTYGLIVGADAEWNRVLADVVLSINEDDGTYDGRGPWDDRGVSLRRTSS